MTPKVIIVHAHPRTGSTSLYNYLIDKVGLLLPYTDHGVRRVHYLLDESSPWFAWRYRATIEMIGQENCAPITIQRDEGDTLRSWDKWRERRGYSGLPWQDSPYLHLQDEVRAFWGTREDLLILEFEDIDEWPKILEEEFDIEAGVMPCVC